MGNKNAQRREEMAEGGEDVIGMHTYPEGHKCHKPTLHATSLALLAKLWGRDKKDAKVGGYLEMAKLAWEVVAA